MTRYENTVVNNSVTDYCVIFGLIPLQDILEVYNVVVLKWRTDWRFCSSEGCIKLVGQLFTFMYHWKEKALTGRNLEPALICLSSDLCRMALQGPIKAFCSCSSNLYTGEVVWLLLEYKKVVQHEGGLKWDFRMGVSNERWLLTSNFGLAVWRLRLWAELRTAQYSEIENYKWSGYEGTPWISKRFKCILNFVIESRRIPLQ